MPVAVRNSSQPPAPCARALQVSLSAHVPGVAQRPRLKPRF